MKKNPAFTLLELIFYIFFMILVVYGICSFFMVSQKNLFQQAHFCERAIRDLVVLDLLRRDIMKGCMQRAAWDESNLVWMQETVDKQGAPSSTWVGWSVVAGGLSRIEGTYNPTRHVWLKKHTSFFGCTLNSLALQLKPEKTASIELVILSYTQARQKQVQRDTIWMRNRVLA